MRHPGNALINLLGLVIGFALFVFAFAFAHYERNYDDFFRNADRIVLPYMRLPENSPMKIEVFHSFFPALAGVATERFAGIEAASILAESEHRLTLGENSYRQSMRFADPAFFDIFDLDLIAGSAEGWGQHPESLLLSRRASVRFFGTTDSVGRTLTLDVQHEVTVVGVYEDLPRNSHLSRASPDEPGLEIIGTIAMFERLNGFELTGNWDSLSSNMIIYLLLEDGADRMALADEITQYTLQNMRDWGFQVFESTILGALTDVNARRWDSQGLPGLTAAQGVGLLILAIAVLNTISLNTAQLIGRSREISLRRIVGAGRTDLIRQLFTESLMATMLALGLSIAALYALMPWTSSLLGIELSLGDMLTSEIIVLLVLSALVVSLLSISYPALLLSGLSGKMSLVRSLQLGHSAPWIRKGLAVIQFSAVTALVLAVLTVNAQITFMIDSAPDFNKDRVVIVRGLVQNAETNKIDVLQNEFERLAGAELVAQSANTPFDGDVWLGVFNQMKRLPEPLTFQMMTVDDRFLDVFGQQLLAGRNFDRNRGEDITPPAPEHQGRGASEEDNPASGARAGEPDEPRISNVIVNELLYRQLGYGSPAEALGKTFVQEASNEDSGDPVQRIVGVLPDTIYGRPNQDVRPTVFRFQPDIMQALSIRFASAADVERALPEIERIGKTILPDEDLDITPLAETMDTAYETQRNIRSGFLATAVIAIILAASGLYALAAFIGASRKREMGIRKVMGARTDQLARGLLWQFSKPVALSLVVGLPLGWWGMGEYLEGFVRRIELGFTLPAQAALLTVLIAFLTVASNAVRTARTRPAEVLRQE